MVPGSEMRTTVHKKDLPSKGKRETIHVLTEGGDRRPKGHGRRTEDGFQGNLPSATEPKSISFPLCHPHDDDTLQAGIEPATFS